MEHIEIVQKLIGRINPIGKSEVDAERFENLINMCDLVYDLVQEIENVARQNRGSYEFSVQRAGEYADNFLTVNLGIKDE